AAGADPVGDCRRVPLRVPDRRLLLVHHRGDGIDDAITTFIESDRRRQYRRKRAQTKTQLRHLPLGAIRRRTTTATSVPWRSPRRVRDWRGEFVRRATSHPDAWNRASPRPQETIDRLW